MAAEADPHSGSANMGVPIAVPSGRGGIQPNIQLQYNSSSPNGLLGVGWTLDLGSVQRSSKSGVPHYDDTDTFILIQSGGAQELVFDAVTGLYRAKTEGSFMKIERIGDSWLVTDKSGTKYYFGETLADREYDPADSSRIFRWSLNKVEDLHGNDMTIVYFSDENKLYPQDVHYTGNSQLGLSTFAHVAFERETRPENEIDQYNSGFRMSMRYRISQITVNVDGQLQRRYDLGYDDSRTTGRSLLTSVTQFGSDGFSVLPPMTFSYQTPNNPDFNYDVTLMNSSGAGDNLWNYRSDGGYDHGSDNYGPCPPTTVCNGYYFNWGPASTIGSGTGDVSLSSGQDTGHWLWTYLYVDSAKTITPLYTTEGVDGVWLRGDFSNEVHQTWNLEPGYNRVDLTLYNQNQGFSFNLNLALANEVNLMSSSSVILPQFSGDFNADGLSDIAKFISDSGTVEVELSDGTTFLSKETWISGFGTNGKLVLGDFNGDGRMDISGFDPASGNWKVALSDGSQFNDQGAAWINGFGTNEEPSIGDFNGDGLADILTFYKSSGNYYVRIALNEEESFVPLTGGQNILIGNADDTPLVGDFNGDGQIDFGTFNKAGGNWNVRLNTGDILAGMAPLPVVSGFGAGHNTVVSDFNYDGLTDIGYYDDSTGKVVYRVSKGSSFAVATELPFAFNIQGPNTNIQSGDYNGDTLIDFAVYDLIGSLEIAYSNGVMPDILSIVDNGLGGQSTIVYDAAVNYPQTFLPFSIRVIKSITKSNGLGEIYTIQNFYEQGLWDTDKREFRGFGLVRQTDPDGNYSETHYAQDDVYKGRVIGQKTYDVSNNLYSETVHTWVSEEVIPGSNFIYLSRKDNFIYDGDTTGRRTAEEFYFGEIPQLGHLTKAVQLGEVDLTTGVDIPGDTRTVETTYVHNTGGTPYLAGLPSLTMVKDNAGAVVRKTWFDYDNLANGAVPVQGLLTRKEDWTGPGGINPVTQYTYNNVGNLLTTTDPLNRTTTITYDTTYNIFPVTTTNAMGHSVVNEYYGVGGVPLDSGDGYVGLWGQLKSTTDPNNQVGKRIYDVFGRTVATVSPLDSIALPTSTTDIQFLGSYTKVTARQRIAYGQPETIDTVSFMDGFGREAQTKTRSAVVGRYVLSGQAQYNSRGLKNKQYLSAFSTNPMEVIDPIDETRPHALITYDAMGRVVQSTNPDGTFSSVGYDDWTTSMIDENGHKQESVFDAYGRLVEKREYRGADGRSPHYTASPYTLYASTFYTYDSEGNLIQTHDAHNNITTISYDTLGRKISMNDPDMGFWQYEYDLNGNLTKQTDAKSQVIQFAYDALNRLTNKKDAIPGGMNVDYTYDDPFVTHSKGRLTKAAYAQGQAEFAYDELGRELESIKKINSQSFSVRRGYDALNRLSNVQYPNGENIAYSYNAAGQIEAVANDVSLLPAVALNVPELGLIQTGDTEVKLNWGAVIDATGYKIKYGTVSGIYGTINDVGNVTSKIITGLTNDTTYYFAVMAYNVDIESEDSNERFTTPQAPTPITMPAPLVQYTFNDNVGNTVVTATGSAAYNATTEQTSSYTSDLTGSGTASASSCLLGCGNSTYNADKAFDNDNTSWDGWVSNNTRSGWIAYEFSSLHKINKYTIAPRGHIYPNDDGNPWVWTFEGFDSSTSGWDTLDTRSFSSWTFQTPVTFGFANDTAYQKYRLNISDNGGHGEVGLAEIEMMAYAPLYTNALSVSGKINNSFNVNGSSQLINADNLLGLKNQSVGSIALWLNPSSPSNDDVVFSMSDTTGQNRVEIRGHMDVQFNVITAVLGLNVTVPNALMTGLWSHVVIVQDGTSLKAYVNGTEAPMTITQQNLGTDAWFNSTWGLDNARIGCIKYNGQANANYYGGHLDDFRYYDYPLNAAEVEALYNTGTGTEELTPQYTDYTPLSKADSVLDGWIILENQLASNDKREIRTYPQEKLSHLQEKLSFPRRRESRFSGIWYFARRASNLARRTGGLIERYVFGVKEAHAQATFTQDSGSDGLVSMEAEHFQSSNIPAGVSHYWGPISKTNQSGDVCLQALPNNGANNNTGYENTSPRLDFTVDFVKTGTHYIWTRGIGINGNGDSYHAGLDNAPSATSDRISSFNTSWTWSKSTMDNVPASVDVSTVGEHTINVWMREDGFILDKIVITTNPDYIPTGLGPDETTQGSSWAGPVLNSPVAGDGQVDLSWNTVPDADGYKVYYGTVSSVYGAPVDVGNVTSYTVPELTNGTTYYFVVTAYNVTGESTNSNEQSAAPNVPPAQGTGTITREVWTGISGTTMSYLTSNANYPDNPSFSDELTLFEAPINWSDNYGTRIRGYIHPPVSGNYTLWIAGDDVCELYLSTDDTEATKTQIARVPFWTYPQEWDKHAQQQSVQISLQADQKYYIEALQKEGAGGDHVAVAWQIPGGVFEVIPGQYLSPYLLGEASVPAAPVLNAPVAGDAQVDLSWNTVPDADGYKVYYGTVGGVYGAPVDVGSLTSYTLTGLTNGSTYYFAVRAYNVSGESGYSNEQSAAPQYSAPDPQLFVTNVDYNVHGQITQMEYGNGDVKAYTYDPLNLRLTRMYATNSLGEVLQDLNYTYDSVGNILSITDNLNSADQSFQYDELNRLTQADGQTYGIKAYQYDEVGNIISKDDLSYTYAEGGAGPHAVTSLTDGTTYTYDANGNMVTKQSPALMLTEYIYDIENRLVRVKRDDLTIAEYEYDGDGGRTKKSTGGVTTEFVGSLYEEDSMGRKTSFVFLGSQRIASITGSDTLYYHADHLGGANVLTDFEGTVKEIIEYKPFGGYARQDKYGTDEEVARYYFTGQRKDEETGLYFYNARYYDPDLGRFITADTRVTHPNDPQDLNRYSYTSNNPVNRIDPTGHGWLKNIFKSLDKIFNKFVNWLEKVTNSKWSVEAEFGQSYEFQDAKTFTQSTARVGYTAVTQPWQFGVGVYRWAHESRYDVLEQKSLGNFVSTSINDGDNLFVDGILNSKKYAFENGEKVYKQKAFKVAYNPTDSVVADITEAFLQKLTFTSSFSRQLARDLSGHKGIALAGHSQGGIVVGNTLFNLGLSGQKGIVDSVKYYNTQISPQRAYFSASLAGVNKRHVSYGSRYFDPSNVGGPNISEPLKVLSGIPGLWIPFGKGHHGIQ